MQTEIRNGTLYISGDVTVKTLTASAFARYEQQCRLKETDSIDFSQVGKADAACLWFPCFYCLYRRSIAHRRFCQLHSLAYDAYECSYECAGFRIE